MQSKYCPGTYALTMIANVKPACWSLPRLSSTDIAALPPEVAAAHAAGRTVARQDTGGEVSRDPNPDVCTAKDRDRKTETPKIEKQFGLCKVLINKRFTPMYIYWSHECRCACWCEMEVFWRLFSFAIGGLGIHSG